MALLFLTLESSTGLLFPSKPAKTTTALLGSAEQDEQNGDLDSLRPPAFNLRKESLLFDETSATKKNNNVLRFWQFCKQKLPRLVHGAREATTADDNPIGALYNMAFVRIPVIATGMIYGINLANGHPLVMDFGDGPFEMNPILVAAMLYILLL